MIYKKIGQRKLYIFVYNKTTLLNKMVESMNEIFYQFKEKENDINTFI